VGTILLIAVTVALAAVVATLVGGLGAGAIPPHPTLVVTAALTDDAGHKSVTITIDHRGSDSITASDIKVIADNNDSGGYIEKKLSEMGVTGTLSVGHNYTLDNYSVTDLNTGATISVTLIHIPSNQQIYANDSVPLT